MLKILHRINTIEQLKNTPHNYGVEMDLHAFGNRLVVHHDPFIDAIDFEKWLDHFHHSFVILNIKEEGIEKRVLDIVNEKNINNFFLFRGGREARSASRRASARRALMGGAINALRRRVICGS